MEEIGSTSKTIHHEQVLQGGISEADKIQE